MPASNLLTLRAMAYNNAWANHRLLSACTGLSQSEFEATRTSFFPSIQATLNHISGFGLRVHVKSPSRRGLGRDRPSWALIARSWRHGKAPRLAHTGT